MFVWVFHRFSGVLLIFLLSFQLLTGLLQTSTSQRESVKVFAEWHRHAVVLGLTVFLLVFHALYGVRTILLDLGAAPGEARCSGAATPWGWSCSARSWSSTCSWSAMIQHDVLIVGGAWRVCGPRWGWPAL